MIQGAFSRSNAVRAIVRNDISPAMANWWKVQKKDDGVISRHLSPYEIQPVMPWIKEWPSIAFNRVTTTGVWWALSAGIVIGTVEASDAATEWAEHANRS